MPPPQDIAAYYDDLSARMLQDYKDGNRRVDRQLHFFRGAIPATTQSILIIGSGLGDSAHFLATKVTPQARILGLDISPECIRLARQLFPHDSITYQESDVLTGSIEGSWDVIILPDVYEHIARDTRQHLHAQLNRLLSPKGLLLFTVPTQALQDWLEETKGLIQPVEEAVTLAEFIKIADDVNGTLTYFAMCSVWHTHDYIHAAIQRDAQHIAPVGLTDQLPIKGWRESPVWQASRILRKTRQGWRAFRRYRRGKFLQRRLKGLPAP